MTPFASSERDTFGFHRIVFAMRACLLLLHETMLFSINNNQLLVDLTCSCQHLSPNQHCSSCGAKGYYRCDPPYTSEIYHLWPILFVLPSVWSATGALRWMHFPACYKNPSISIVPQCSKMLWCHCVSSIERSCALSEKCPMPMTYSPMLNVQKAEKC